jgi:hypothetical protein
LNHDLVGLGHISGYELDTRFQKSADEMNIPGQPVQLGDDQGRLVLLTRVEGQPKLWPASKGIAAFAALDFNELATGRPSAALKVLGDRMTLGFKSEAR